MTTIRLPFRGLLSVVLFVLALVAAVGVLPLRAHAQSLEDGAVEQAADAAADQPPQEPEPEYRAVAGQDQNVAIDRKILFDASASVLPKDISDRSVRYRWDFGDGTFQEGIDVTHTYTTPGDFEVTLTVTADNLELTDTASVSVYEDVVLLIADRTPSATDLESLRRTALRQGVLLVTIVNDDQGADYVVEGSLVDSLVAERDIVAKTNVVVLWTEGALGVNVLSSFAAKVGDVENLNFPNKGIVVATNQPLTALSRLAQSAYDALRPDYILLTPEQALPDVVTARTPENVLNEVQKSGVSSRLIGVYSGRGTELSWNNFISFGVNYMINRGVSVENILLLLILPVIATIVALARQFLGVKTFGIYTPSIIALTFVVSGLRLGLGVFLIIIAVATAMRYIMRWFKLAYLPRLAIVLTVVSATIFLVLLGGAATERTGITFLSIFPFLVLVMLVEKFVTAQSEKGLRSAIFLSLQTILVAIASYYLVTWSTFRTFLLAYPETLLLIPVLNIIAGRWTGLRLSEYFRFRSVRRGSEPDESLET